MKAGHIKNVLGQKKWQEICDVQGWNEGSQIIHLEGFIREKGLFEKFASYAEKAANEENAEAKALDIK